MATLPKYNQQEDVVKVKRANTEAELMALEIGPNEHSPVEMGIFKDPSQSGLKQQLETARRLLREGKDANDTTKIYTQKRFIALLYTAASVNNISLG